MAIFWKKKWNREITFWGKNGNYLDFIVGLIWSTYFYFMKLVWCNLAYFFVFLISRQKKTMIWHVLNNMTYNSRTFNHPYDHGTLKILGDFDHSTLFCISNTHLQWKCWFNGETRASPCSWNMVQFSTESN